MNGYFDLSQGCETRSYSVSTKINKLVRNKENQEDYMFMPEPNVRPLVLSNKFLAECWSDSCPKTPIELRRDLVKDKFADNLIVADWLVRQNVFNEYKALIQAGLPKRFARSILKNEFIQFRHCNPKDVKFVLDQYIVEVATEIYEGRMQRRWFEKALLEKVDGIPILLD
ncbi:hypothetical protein ACOME3_003312 [Neoechinorhynchus agilis]